MEAMMRQSNVKIPELQVLCKRELINRVITGDSIVPQGKESDSICLEMVGKLSLLGIKQLVKSCYQCGKTDARHLIDCIQSIGVDELACAWIVGEKELNSLLKIPNRSQKMVKSVDGNPNYLGFLEYVEKKRNEMKIRTTFSMSLSFSLTSTRPTVMSKKEYLGMIPYGYDPFDWLERGYRFGLIEPERQNLTYVPEYRLKSFEDYQCEKKGMIYCPDVGYVWPHHWQLIEKTKEVMGDLTMSEIWDYLIDQGQVNDDEYDTHGLERQKPRVEICSPPQKIYVDISEEQRREMERRIQEEKVKQAQQRKQKELEKLKLQREQEKQKKKTQQSLAAAKAKKKQQNGKKK